MKDQGSLCILHLSKMIEKQYDVFCTQPSAVEDSKDTQRALNWQENFLDTLLCPCSHYTDVYQSHASYEPPHVESFWNTMVHDIEW